MALANHSISLSSNDKGPTSREAIGLSLEASPTANNTSFIARLSILASGSMNSRKSRAHGAISGAPRGIIASRRRYASSGMHATSWPPSQMAPFVSGDSRNNADTTASLLLPITPVDKHYLFLKIFFFRSCITLYLIGIGTTTHLQTNIFGRV